MLLTVNPWGMDSCFFHKTSFVYSVYKYNYKKPIEMCQTFSNTSGKSLKRIVNDKFLDIIIVYLLMLLPSHITV